MISIVFCHLRYHYIPSKHNYWPTNLLICGQLFHHPYPLYSYVSHVLLPEFQWWFISRLSEPTASCLAAVLVLYLQAPSCKDLPEGSAAPAVSCLCIGSLCAATIASYSLFSLRRSLHCQEKEKEIPAAIKYICSAPYVLVPYCLRVFSCPRVSQLFQLRYVCEHKLAHSFTQWVPWGPGPFPRGIFPHLQGSTETPHAITSGWGEQDRPFALFLRKKIHLTSGTQPPSKVIWHTDYTRYCRVNSFLVLQKDLPHPPYIHNRVLILRYRGNHTFTCLSQLRTRTQCCRAARKPAAVHVTLPSHVPAPPPSSQTSSTWKAQFPLPWEEERTISETTCPWLTTSYRQRTSEHAQKHKNAGNAKVVLEGRSLFPHPTFEHLVWLYCFVAPGGSTLESSMCHRWLKISNTTTGTWSEV